MPSKQYNGGYSRAVHHGNMMNKKGCAAMYQKSVVSTKAPSKFKRAPIAPKSKVTVTLDDLVVKAGPPKKEKCKELRYTIPDVPVNGNIATQTFIRTHAKMAVTMNDFKTQVKVKNFNEDREHEIEIM
mmetsp:Transcript_123579/g.242467  ORF Transcript_123579/g.242467 Transcript_123579/m.242467 type:complete len:128 (-) Transcript_123579:308-691(-)|eukprot:CAMPEP_0170393354 /NCGR_PEP_ID=MMETSP0117_2-20130122/20683_1 /TAXON_ID=400756 /ORGANISM="Durinskia baltica, Strain CSIRO CS-38" /LENGTH=127 /DNA_ID=CAMNT_0010649557 /DNA_START=47 /DNA_END=430 /DNA_ORIENTATION=+